jgi:hypothetical protein
MKRPQPYHEEYINSVHPDKVETWKSVTMDISILPKWAGSSKPKAITPRTAKKYIESTRTKVM